MSKQTTRVGGFPLYPECTVVLKVTGVKLKSKRDNKSVKFYVWDFDLIMADNEELENELQFLFFSSQMGELLEAMGYEETTPGEYDWDDEEVIGKCVRARIVHEIFKGQTKHTLKEITTYEEEASEEPTGEIVDAGDPKSWDEDLNPNGTPIK